MPGPQFLNAMFCSSAVKRRPPLTAADLMRKDLLTAATGGPGLQPKNVGLSTTSGPNRAPPNIRRSSEGHYSGLVNKCQRVFSATLGRGGFNTAVRRTLSGRPATTSGQLHLAERDGYNCGFRAQTCVIRGITATTSVSAVASCMSLIVRSSCAAVRRPDSMSAGPASAMESSKIRFCSPRAATGWL